MITWTILLVLVDLSGYNLHYLIMQIRQVTFFFLIFLYNPNDCSIEMYPVYGHFIKMSVSMLPNFLPDPVEN